MGDALVLDSKELKLPPQKILKLMLSSFWDEFGGTKCWGGGFPQSKKLRLLRQYAEVKITVKRGRHCARKRQEFELVKSKRHKLRTLKRCFVCLEGAEHRHHIVPLSQGGDNRKRNLVSLCAACHRKIHPWMSDAPAP